MFDNMLQSEGEEGYGQNRQAPNLDMERMEGGFNALMEAEQDAGIDTFWKVRQEREEQGYSPTSEAKKAELHQKETDLINIGLQQVFTDPSVSLADRETIAGLQVTNDRKETPLPQKLGQELLIRDDETAGEPATDEQEAIRGQFIEHYGKHVEYRSVQQSIIEQANFEESNTGASMIVDLVQMVVPFVEQSNVAEALNSVGKGDKSFGAFLALGEFKQQFFDSFHKMPTDDRLKAFDQMIAITKEANTTAFVTNGLLEEQMRQELVYGGNYGDGMRAIDNLVSWFDLSLLGKPVSWAVRTGQRVSQAGKIIKAARTFEQAAKTNEAGLRLMRQMRMERVKTTVSPISPIRVAADTNAESGKGMFLAVVSDTTEEAAGAFGGTSRIEVVADSLLPEMRHTELIGQAGEKLPRGEQKALRSQRHELVSKLAKLEPVTVKDVPIESGKGVSARAAKKAAEKKASTATADARQVIQDRIDHIDLQLNKSSKGAKAEAELSRIEQGVARVEEKVVSAVEEAVPAVEKVTPRVSGGLPKFHQDALDQGAGVRAKIHNIDAHSVTADYLPPEIRTALDESQVNAAVRSEMASAAANEVNKLQDVVGLVSRNEMFGHSVTPTGAKIHAVYGTSKTGFANAEDAFAQAEMALRGHGIERSNMYLMQKSKETGEYGRVNPAEVVGNDFLIGIDFNYRINFSDIMSWDKLSVKKNFLDRIPLLADHSINRNFFDPASILDQHLFLGANAKVDRTAQVTQDFLNVGKKFSDRFGKASKESQAAMYKYILEANEQQIPHNINTLRGEHGFSLSEIETLDAFREFWDMVWQARNMTDVKALRNKGYGIYTNAKGDRLFSRPIVKGQVNRNEKVYDPSTGVSKYMDNVELQKLYDEGHTIGKLRRPQQVGGAITDHMILRNDNGWRSLRESDNVYPYREGYFQRMYKAPVFITKSGVTSGGVKFHKAIATADTVSDAKVYRARLMENDSKSEYIIRNDVKDPRAQGEFEMDTFESNGMSSQYERGDKLVDSTAAVRGTEESNVLSPVDAIIASSRSMGRKVVMGDFIEAAKQRFMKQFAGQLETERGMVKYPKSMSDIGAKGMGGSKEAADARSTYEYISFLEYGYINGMDSVYKGALKGLADIVAGWGFRAGEVGLTKLAEISPSSLSKNLAFQMYIALNPFRQAALNAHQSVLLTATFPTYVASQRMAADMHAFMYMRMGIKMPKAAIKLTGRTEAELEFMWKQYRKSGMSAAIDQQNMIRGSMMDMVESQRFKGETNLITKGLSLSRRSGFDVGEEIQVNTAWLAHYDDAVKKNGFLDASQLDRVAGKARNFTFNMNRAGDMPYNANSLSVFFQFVQVPHKSLLQMSNRAISGADRTKLFMFNATMFTLPPVAMYDLFGSWLPDREKSPDLHNAFVQGLEFMLFNKALSLMTGEDVNTDFGNLAAADQFGLYEFMRGGLTTEAGAMYANSPSGQLIFGSNPRIANLFHTISEIVNPSDVYSMSPVELDNVYKDLALLSSGMSNIFKSKMALDYKMARGIRGQILDPDVSTAEAIMLAFGFRTMEMTTRAWIGMDMYEKDEAYAKDVNQWYKNLTRKLAQDGQTPQESEYTVKVLSMSFKAFGSSQKAMGIIRRNLDRDAIAGKGVIYENILKRIDYVAPEDMLIWSKLAPEDGRGSKEALEATVEFVRKHEEAK